MGHRNLVVFTSYQRYRGGNSLQYSRGQGDKIGRFGIGRRYWESHFNE